MERTSDIAPSPPYTNTSTRRLSVLEVLIEAEPLQHDYIAQPSLDEELPSYEEHNLPAYAERHLQAPVVSYCIYQITRKVQVITPAALSNFDQPRYRVSTRGSPSLFSKKADYTLTRVPAGRALESKPEKDVALMNANRSGEIPWMPRATVMHGEDPNNRTKYPMQARNFQDWTITFNSINYVWRLADKPTSLVLIEISSDSIVSRFSYSKDGTDATRGAEVGQLDIYGGSQSEEQDTIELVIASCLVAINHFKCMGRHYRNNVTPRTCSIGAAAMGNSFFATDPLADSRRASHSL